MRANKNGVNKDQKDKVKKDGYNRGQHCVYCLTYHMIFVTHYRKPVINDEMSAAMKEFSNHMAEHVLPGYGYHRKKIKTNLKLWHTWILLPIFTIVMDLMN